MPVCGHVTVAFRLTRQYVFLAAERLLFFFSLQDCCKQYDGLVQLNQFCFSPSHTTIFRYLIVKRPGRVRRSRTRQQKPLKVSEHTVAL
jgi:hypothetical protein